MFLDTFLHRPEFIKVPDLNKVNDFRLRFCITYDASLEIGCWTGTYGAFIVQLTNHTIAWSIPI